MGDNKTFFLFLETKSLGCVSAGKWGQKPVWSRDLFPLQSEVTGQFLEQ
jgi:hypothetical protein